MKQFLSIFGLVLVSFVPSPSLLGAGTSVRDVVKIGLQNPMLIRSYEFVAIEESGVSGSPPMRQKSKFVQTGSLYRSDLYESDVAADPFAIMAFNGERYQNFDDKLKALSYTRKNRFPNPYGAMNPMVIPYVWLFETPSATWPDITSPDVWTDRLQDAAILPETTLHGTEVVGVLFAVSRPAKLTYRVWFSKNQGFLPIRFEGLQESKVQFEVSVSDCRSFEQEGQTIWFPMNIRTQTDDMVTQYIVDPQSLKLNPKLDEEQFTLSPSMATFVDDYDRNMAYYQDAGLLLPDQAPIEAKGGRPIFRSLFVLGGCVIGVMVARSIYLYRIKRSNVA